ncbi:MAG: hypothetical protein COV35_07555 [Alphaproteobacteria bacterium CG11_big_fil_rev_8_21_14_0_20_39_49]|nr:MAG: hypothetical protein COV35_07555 [Alphaproteobacteria bacterium CG11_big_fil_rev_8_21_14_0_20_39_49]
MKKLFLCFLVLLTFSPKAYAGALPEDTISAIRWYKVYWSGIHVADLKAHVKEDGLDAIIESYGIVKKVSKYESVFKTRFNYVEGEFVPDSYYTEFQQRNGGRKIDIKFNKDGTVAKEEVTPPDNRAKRPAVSEKLKHDTFDPLTAFMAARKKVKESLEKGNNSFSIKMYDGRRLSDLDFKIEGRFDRKISGTKHKLVKVTFKRKPIEGYTQNELKRMQKEEPVFTLYLSDDEKLLPIKMDADAPLGTAVLLFEKDCPSLDKCA